MRLSNGLRFLAVVAALLTGGDLAAQSTATLNGRVTDDSGAAPRAIGRKTPVAYTDVKKVQIQNQLGSQDLPMVLNVTPSSSATAPTRSPRSRRPGASGARTSRR